MQVNAYAIILFENFTMFNIFENWNYLKNKLHSKPDTLTPFFYEREIWWCSLGQNIGYEQDGKNDDYSRPVVILKIFNRLIFWALPLTTKNKIGRYYYHYKYKNREYSVILSQLRLISSKRLIRKIGVMSKNDFLAVRKQIRDLI